MQGKKILITGASGMFGRGLVHVLHKKNEVHALARFTNPAVREEIEKKAKVWKVDMSVERPTMLPKDFDVVFHMAVEWTADDTLEHQNKSYHMTCDFVSDLIYRNEKASFLLGSTGSVYQHQVPLVKEDETPLGGRRTYEVSKIAMERLARWIAGTFGRKVVVMRYFFPYAPYLDHEKVDAYLRGEPFGECPRSIHSRTYIKQHVDKSILAVECASNPPMIFNCASDEYLTLRQLAEIGAKVAGVPVSPAALEEGPEPGRGVRADVTKLVKYLGPTTVKTEEGFRRYLRGRTQKIDWPEDWMFEGPMR
jgi:nucleoside-diphosphate-sugar epimerase